VQTELSLSSAGLFVLLDIRDGRKNTVHFLSDVRLRKQLEGTGGHSDDVTGMVLVLVGGGLC
jgi:hypothetical protein